MSEGTLGECRPQLEIETTDVVESEATMHYTRQRRASFHAEGQLYEKL